MVRSESAAAAAPVTLHRSSLRARASHRYIANNSERSLELGPFQGRTAVSRISFDKGVCGACARQAQCVVVADVHAFPGHIACDAASNRFVQQ